MEKVKHTLMETPEERFRREIEFYNQSVIDRNGRRHDQWGRFEVESQEEWEPEKTLFERLEELGLLSVDFKRERMGTYKRVTRLGLVAWDIIIVVGIGYLIHVIFS